MSLEYLATGFADVDARKDDDAYKRCLSLLDSLPYFSRYKHRSYELLALSPGLSVLEVGCGLADDALRMVKLIAPGGTVVGTDRSAKMIAAASARTPRGAPIRFAQADARRLPFSGDSFDRCRVDRTLQYVPDPQNAVREMVRVLKSNGILLAYDNDWGTFSVSGGDDAITRIIETMWAGSFTNPRIGRHLKRYFVEAGLLNVRVEASVSVISEYDLADRVYNLMETAKRAVNAGRITLSAADDWVAQLQEQSRCGTFLCTLTALTATGIKP